MNNKYSILASILLFTAFSANSVEAVSTIEVKTSFHKEYIIENNTKNMMGKLLLNAAGKNKTKIKASIFLIDQENSKGKFSRKEDSEDANGNQTELLKSKFEINIVEKMYEKWKVNVDFFYSWEDENIKNLYHYCSINKVFNIANMETKSFKFAEDCNLDITMILEDNPMKSPMYKF